MSTSLNIDNFVDISKIFHQKQFRNKTVLELLGTNLTEFILDILKQHGVTDHPVIKGTVHPSAILEGPIYVSENAEIGPTAYIKGPCWIGSEAEIRHGAFIRGSVYVGPKAVVGHTTEAKGSIFFDKAKAGHFAYVGDSILGFDVNLGAGTKLANLKMKGKEVKVTDPNTDQQIATGLRKFGAVLGDSAQTGCNAVLSPGTLLLPKTGVYPCVHYMGTLKKGFIKS